MTARAVFLCDNFCKIISIALVGAVVLIYTEFPVAKHSSAGNNIVIESLFDINAVYNGLFDIFNLADSFTEKTKLFAAVFLGRFFGGL